MDENGNINPRAKKVPVKSMCLIIGNKENNDFLELPLLTLTSPFTAMRALDKNGVRKF
jgi:hypothetical protein